MPSSPREREWHAWVDEQRQRAESEPNAAGPPQTTLFWDWQKKRLSNRLRDNNAQVLDKDPHFLKKRAGRRGDPPQDRNPPYTLGPTYSPKWEDRFDACTRSDAKAKPKINFSATKKLSKRDIRTVVDHMHDQGELDDYYDDDGRVVVAKAFTADFMDRVKQYICRWPRPSELALMLYALSTLDPRSGQAGVKSVDDQIRGIDEHYYYAKIRLYNNGGRIVGGMGAYFAHLTRHYGLLYVWMHTAAKEDKDGDAPHDILIYSAHIPNLSSAIVDIMHRMNAVNEQLDYVDGDDTSGRTKYLTSTNQKAESFPTDAVDFRSFPKTTLYKARLDKDLASTNNWGDEAAKKEHVPMFRSGSPEENRKNMDDFVKNNIVSSSSRPQAQAQAQALGNAYEYGYNSSSDDEIDYGVCWPRDMTYDAVARRAHWILNNTFQYIDARALDDATYQWYAAAAYHSALYSVSTPNCMYAVPDLMQPPAVDPFYGYQTGGGGGRVAAAERRSGRRNNTTSRRAPSPEGKRECKCRGGCMCKGKGRGKGRGEGKGKGRGKGNGGARASSSPPPARARRMPATTTSTKASPRRS